MIIHANPHQLSLCQEDLSIGGRLHHTRDSGCQTDDFLIACMFQKDDFLPYCSSLSYQANGKAKKLIKSCYCDHCRLNIGHFEHSDRTQMLSCTRLQTKGSHVLAVLTVPTTILSVYYRHSRSLQKTHQGSTWPSRDPCIAVPLNGEHLFPGRPVRLHIHQWYHPWGTAAFS